MLTGSVYVLTLFSTVWNHSSDNAQKKNPFQQPENALFWKASKWHVYPFQTSTNKCISFFFCPRFY